MSAVEETGRVSGVIAGENYPHPGPLPSREREWVRKPFLKGWTV
jgi:hypothetical protein